MLTSRLMAAAAVVLTLAAPTAARAQDKGDTGLTMGYPTNIGFVYHVTDRLAIRPEISLAVSSGTSASTVSVIEGDTVSLGVGVSAIFYLKQYDKLRTYLSPRYTYGHGESTTTSTFDPPFGDDGENTQTSHSHGFMGTFGAQYAVGERFSIFGEVGASFSRSRSRTNLSGLRSTSNQFTTRTAAGVILYF